MTKEFADAVEERLSVWRCSLFDKIPVAGLLARSKVAHKWKAPFRSLMVREATFWRAHDLLTQSYALYRQEHLLGARILLRSGYETLAMLIYLNMQTESVLKSNIDFHVFAEKTTQLLLGSRNNEAMPKAINIVTILEKCDKRYPGLMARYADLSESAHPNYEGLCAGYSKINPDEYETIFSNRWMELHGDNHLDAIMLCMETFHHEYNDLWNGLFGKLEKWIEAHDAELEASRPKQPASD